MNCSHSKADSDDRQRYPIDPGSRSVYGFVLEPVYSGVQSLTRSGYNIGRNLTQQTHDEINIALPSIDHAGRR
jgi:hypothetical protein